MSGKKTLILTVPFGEYENSPLDLLRKNAIDITVNPLGRKPSEEETIAMLKEQPYFALIAGTSPITPKVMDASPSLKIVARAGVGIDNVDLSYAKQKGIAVTYTPHAPINTVAEFTVGLLISSLRMIHRANANLHQGVWKKELGYDLSEVTVGILGLGAIGQRLVLLLKAFGCKIMAHDAFPNQNFARQHGIELVDKETLFRQAGVITVHLPLNNQTINAVTIKELSLMKPTASIINTSRGGIINEDDLCVALEKKLIAGAALDVFNDEPYKGKLVNYPNCLLTSHIASSTENCKRVMETSAAQEVVRCANAQPLEFPVK